MNLYICSTLRHLLFSVLKAKNEPNQESHILFFYDYQDIDMNMLDTTCLPDHIKLTLLSRKELTRKLKQSLKGKLYLFLSLRTINLPELLKNKLKIYISGFIPGLSISNKKIALFVFNERNKMSRLFRTMVSEYEMIEDGVGNYFKVPTVGTQGIVRFLQNKPTQYWLFGEEARCKRIYVVSPEKLPEDIQHKAVQIDFLKNKKNIALINGVFKFSPTKKNPNNSMIIATMPTGSALFNKLKNKQFLFQLNQHFIDFADEHDIAVSIKTHPSESIKDYDKYFPNINFLPSKLPLELFILNAEKSPTIISIASSAGIGFEDYCRRITLIPESSLEGFVDIILSWENNEDKLKETVIRSLT